MILAKARSFLRRSPFERRLLVSAWLMLVLARVGLLLFQFGTIHRLQSRIKIKPRSKPRDWREVDEQVADAVQVASRYIPGPVTCLPRALAAATLLKRLGSPAHLRIGVARGESGEFQAHAWVENEGRVIIGVLEDLNRYSPFPSMPE